MLNGSFEEFFKDYKFASQEEQKRKEFKENPKTFNSLFMEKNIKKLLHKLTKHLNKLKSKHYLEKLYIKIY